MNTLPHFQNSYYPNLNSTDPSISDEQMISWLTSLYNASNLTNEQGAEQRAGDLRKAATTYDKWKQGLAESENLAKQQTLARLQEQGYDISSPDIQNWLNEYITNQARTVHDPGTPYSTEYMKVGKNRLGKALASSVGKGLTAGMSQGNAGQAFKDSFNPNNIYKPTSFSGADTFSQLPDTATLYNPDALATSIAQRYQAKAQAPNQAQALEAQNAYKQVASQYDPYKAFTDYSSLDPTASNVLNTGFNDALQQLTRKKELGVLTQTGYDRALSELNNQKSVGSTKLLDLVNGAQASNRTSLSDALAAMKTAADTAATTNTPFNADSWNQRIQDTIAKGKNTVEGSILGASNPSDYFNWQKAMQIGGGVQGGVNPLSQLAKSGSNINGPTLSNSFATQKARTATQRTLGSGSGWF